MNGIIVINKPKGFTSHDVVAKVKKILNIKKVGHTGTLDPNATGVLPLLLNEGTKLSKYLIDHDKEYEVILKLGIKTDTADGEGKIIEEKDVNNIDEKVVEQVLKSFIGKQKQTPPIYSAIKINGKKLYEYARSGQTVEIQTRDIEIYSIKLLDTNKKDSEIKFRVACSKGTYIRSLCEDIAKKLDTIGYMKELNRIKVGRFNLEDSITIEELENKKNDIEYINEHIITLKELFSSYDSIDLNNDELKKFLNGVKIHKTKKDGIYNIYNNKKYIGIGVSDDNFIKRDIIL